MANALRTTTPPPLPRPTLTSGALKAIQPHSAPGQQQQMPAPSHQHVVAALRHFEAIKKPLEAALKDPDLGRVDLKQKIIDGMVELVADRIIAPGAAVKELSTFPERLFDQRGWLLDHLHQALDARDAVLDHHRMTNLPMSAPPPPPSADTHIQDLASMIAGHYGGGNG